MGSNTGFLEENKIKKITVRERPLALVLLDFIEIFEGRIGVFPFEPWQLDGQKNGDVTDRWT